MISPFDQAIQDDLDNAMETMATIIAVDLWIARLPWYRRWWERTKLFLGHTARAFR